MTKVSVDASLIKEAIAKLNANEEALEKAASVQRELELIYGVVELAQKGLIDPADIMEKVAEYAECPESFVIFKKAVELRSGGGSLGRLASDSSDQISKLAAYGDSPEATLFSKLSDIVKY